MSLLLAVSLYGIIEPMSDSEIEVIEPRYEIIEYGEHGECRFYPASGGVFKVQPNGSMLIVGNIGGRPDMTSEVAAAMGARRQQLKNEAIANGLIKAGMDKDLPAGTPWAIVEEIVRARAKMALNENRDGNEAAKFIFSIIKDGEEKAAEENSITFKLTKDQMDELTGKLFE